MDEETKPWYVSKTIWVNLIGLVSAILFAAGVISAELDPATVAIILTVINFILRMITKSEIVWKNN